MSDDPTRRESEEEPGIPPSDPPYDDPHPPGLHGPATEQADPPSAADPVSDPPAQQPPPPVPPPAAASGSPGPEAPGPPSPGERWAAPQAPSPGQGTPAPEAGFTSGDPLGGSATPGFERGDPTGTAPAPTPYPGGYTTPPPPGAGGPPLAGTAAPRPIAGQYVLSGWWRRVGAALIDGLLIVLLAILIMAPLGIGLFSLGDDDTVGFFALIGALLLAMLVIAVVGLAYAPIMMAQTNGKTIGRMVTGIRVVRANGQRMTFGWAALREVAVKALLINAVAGSVTFGLASLIDVLWPLWDDENRALHDFVVDTRTVVD